MASLCSAKKDHSAEQELVRLLGHRPPGLRLWLTKQLQFAAAFAVPAARTVRMSAQGRGGDAAAAISLGVDERVNSRESGRPSQDDRGLRPGKVHGK